jgi:hypothetical protein
VFAGCYGYDVEVGIASTLWLQTRHSKRRAPDRAFVAAVGSDCSNRSHDEFPSTATRSAIFNCSDVYVDLLAGHGSPRAKEELADHSVGKHIHPFRSRWARTNRLSSQ